jgi:hypothetical protein
LRTLLAAQRCMICWLMNWKRRGRKRQWPNIIYYPGIFLQGLSKTTKNLSQDILCPDWIWNRGLPNSKLATTFGPEFPKSLQLGLLTHSLIEILTTGWNRKILSQWHFVNHKSLMFCPGIEPVPRLW